MKARLISMGQKGRGGVIKTAEVVMVLGGRHYTVHTQKTGGRYMGYNPDKAELARLDAAEATERVSADHLKTLTEGAENLPKFINAAKESLKEEGLTPEDKKAIKANAREYRRQLKTTLALIPEATKQAEEDKAKADTVRGEVPRIIEVVF